VPDETLVLTLPPFLYSFMEIILYFSHHNGVGLLQYLFPHPIYSVFCLSTRDESIFERVYKIAKSDY